MTIKVNDKSKTSNKNWRVVEYFVPITEAVTSGKDFLIKGTAINETTTRNGVTYIASELEMAAPSFRNKPIMTDHSGSIKDIVGRTTENVGFNSMQKSIEFEGRIMDNKIKEMINDGRITDVSIGASVKDLVEDKKAGTITAVGLEGMEISLVAIPGDPGANLANALHESFNLKENKMKENDTQLNSNKEDKMEEAEKSETEKSEQETNTEEPAKESSSTVTNVNVDMSAVTESIKALTEQVSELATKVKEQEESEESPAPVEAEKADETEDEIPKPVEDETTGDVGDSVEEPKETEEGFVVEQAEIGKGLQMFRDYSKDTGKFNRLCR